MANKKLEVKDLQISFKTDHGLVRAVRNISFDLYEGETLCIVGESGSGKSVTSKAIMGILANNAIIDNGSIMYNGENLLEVSEDEFYKIRGHKIGMIFQDPLSSLNPIVRIGKQITEATLINSDKLKLMYNDLISEDLIAYKNTISKMNIRINAEKQKIVVFESEQKKNLEKFEKDINALYQQIDDKKYEHKINLMELKNSYKEVFANLASELDAKVQEYVNKQDAELAATKENLEKSCTDAKELKAKFRVAEQDAKEKLKEFKDNVKSEYDAKLYSAKNELDAKIQELAAKHNSELLTLNESVNRQVQEIKAQMANYAETSNEELKELKAPLKDKIKTIKEEALVKAKPLKEKLKVTQKVAKEKVKEYKNKVTNEHKQRLSVLKLELSNASTDEEKKAVKEQIEKENLEFVNELRITKAEAKRRALEIMREVGIPQPEKRFKQYPFEFSGGMRQRIVIAIALTEAPEILICDEPTTALDVTIQAQILELIKKIQKERNISCIFITHDLGVVANMADRVAVMYAGKIVEYGTADEIFFEPKHPYTWALLSSIPDVDSKEKLETIPGTPPNMIYPPKGDAFALRSKYAMKVDFEKEPPFFKLSDTHYAATWLLHPDAPKVSMPKIVEQRIINGLKYKKDVKKGEATNEQ